MKKVIIVSPYFAPENSVASIRFTKIAKYLVKQGYDVSVICTRMTNLFLVDKTLQEDLEYLKNVQRINYPKFLYYTVKKYFGIEKLPEKKDITEKRKEHEKKKQLKTNSRLKSYREMLVQLHVFVCDWILARKYIHYIRKKQVKCDVLITTFSPYAPHMLGKYMKKKGLCKTWIADFRDTYMAMQESNFVTRSLENYGVHTIKDADHITTVSMGELQKLKNEALRHGMIIPKEKLVRVTNGFDLADRKNIESIEAEKGKLIFTYCGSIYNFNGKIRADVSPLFRALALLIKNNKINKNNIEIHYAGTCNELFLGLAEKYGVDDLVIYEGVVGREKSLELQRSSDIVIVAIQNDKSNLGIMSGKFFETILVQRNVLCLVKGDQGESELGSVVRENHYGFVYEEVEGYTDNRNELKKWIENAYNEKMQNGKLKYHATQEESKAFSHEALAQNMSRLFD